MESQALPSPDLEVLIKKITELRSEPGWWVESCKFPVGDERHKCDPAAWPPGFTGSYARESLLWLELMNGRGVGSSSWVGSLAKERWGLSFADSEQWCCCQRGLQLYQLRAAWGATGQLSGIWLGLWVSTSGLPGVPRKAPLSS